MSFQSIQTFNNNDNLYFSNENKKKNKKNICFIISAQLLYNEVNKNKEKICNSVYSYKFHINSFCFFFHSLHRK